MKLDDPHTMPIRVVIADDHPVFRDGLRVLIDATADMTLAGEAANGEAAVASVDEAQPDVILMDLKMPVIDGLEATRRILHTSPHIRVLVLTMADDAESVFTALQAGARGYLLKGALKADVLRAIRAVASDDAIFGPAVAQRLLHHFASARPPVGADAFPELTEREREILDYLAHGRGTQEIAGALRLSPKTIRNHVANICTKLQVEDRAQAILRARDAGLGRR